MRNRMFENSAFEVRLFFFTTYRRKRCGLVVFKNAATDLLFMYRRFCSQRTKPKLSSINFIYLQNSRYCINSDFVPSQLGIFNKVVRLVTR